MRVEYYEECAACGRTNDAGAMTALTAEGDRTHETHTVRIPFGDICGCRGVEIKRRGIKRDANGIVLPESLRAWQDFLALEAEYLADHRAAETRDAMRGFHV